MPPFLAQGMAGSDPQGLWDVLRHDVIPVAAAYLVFLGLLFTYRVSTRRKPSCFSPQRSVRSRGGDDAGWGELARYVAGMAAGGYLVFLSIVLVFYFVLGGEDRGFIRQALVEGSILAFGVVVPAFLAFSGLSELIRRRSRQRQAGH